MPEAFAHGDHAVLRAADAGKKLAWSDPPASGTDHPETRHDILRDGALCMRKKIHLCLVSPVSGLRAFVGDRSVRHVSSALHTTSPGRHKRKKP